MTRQSLSYGQNEKSLLKLIIHLFFGFRFFGYKKLFFYHISSSSFYSCLFHRYACVCVSHMWFRREKNVFSMFSFFFVRIDRTTSLYCFFSYHFFDFFRHFCPYFLSSFCCCCCCFQNLAIMIILFINKLSTRIELYEYFVCRTFFFEKQKKSGLSFFGPSIYWLLCECVCVA